jgi:cyclic dehypoxanthinyl futalosine synthase
MGISREEALECFRSDDLIGIGMEADAVRRRLHPEGVVSYAVEYAINSAELTGGMGGGAAAVEASLDGMYDAIGEAGERGSTGLRLHCDGALGLESKICGMERLEGIFRGLRQRFSSLWIEALSAAEIVKLASGCGLELRETIARLNDAGLDSIAGDGADLLDAGTKDRAARRECSVTEWVAVHRAAHGLGMQTVATMRFGVGQNGTAETTQQRVDFLTAVRRLQEETGGFTGFVPQGREAPGCRKLDGVTATEWLKTLAVSRIFLDNIENVQSSAMDQGLKVLQTGLRFGGNDAGSVAPEGIATQASGTVEHASEEDLRRIIRDAGFQPVQRDSIYRAMFLN